MKKVTILAMFNTMASAVIGPMDIFFQAGVIWNYFQGEKPRPFFKTQIVTTDGKPFKCLNGIIMSPDGSTDDVDAYVQRAVVEPLVANECITFIDEPTFMKLVLNEVLRVSGFLCLCPLG